MGIQNAPDTEQTSLMSPIMSEHRIIIQPSNSISSI